MGHWHWPIDGSASSLNAVNRVRIKICGVVTPDDAAFALDTGADAVGLNFYPKSPRYLPPDATAWEERRLPPLAVTVGVFVDAPTHLIENTIQRYRLAAVQTYGVLPVGQTFAADHIPAFRVKDESDLEEIRRTVETMQPAAVLIDSFVPGELGGTGHRAPWRLLSGFDPGVPVILAGGLTPENVVEAIRVVRPWGVDVASGVETAPGLKDPSKVAAFIRAVRSVSL